jgi:SAM-dependent methyltransferase
MYPERWVALPRLTLAAFRTPEHDQWVEDNGWMVDYSVFMDDKEKAKGLAEKLQEAFLQNPSHPDIPSLVSELWRLRSKSLEERTALEYWTHSAYQLADYCGGFDPYNTIRGRLKGYSGEILEAMCGHITYFGESSKRNVIALDYCRTSLERYPFPHRRRIQCDLDQVSGTAQLPFFSEGALDAISICFGFKYPRHIEKLVTEFRRILKPSGILSFIENPGHGYENLCLRRFNQKEIRELLKTAGFDSVTISELKIQGWDEQSRSPFYHVEATK